MRGHECMHAALEVHMPVASTFHTQNLIFHNTNDLTSNGHISLILNLNLTKFLFK